MSTSIKAWLDFLYGEVGNQFTNFSLCYADPNGKFSKWKTYMDVAAHPELAERVNQRTSLFNEIILDYDGDWDGYLWLIKQLKQYGIWFYAYATDSHRAKAIHTFWGMGLAQLTPYERSIKREIFIRHFGCDLQLKIDRHMIPLEYAKHWKTGETKELIDCEEE